MIRVEMFGASFPILKSGPVVEALQRAAKSANTLVHTNSKVSEWAREQDIASNAIADWVESISGGMTAAKRHRLPLYG